MHWDNGGADDIDGAWLQDRLLEHGLIVKIDDQYLKLSKIGLTDPVPPDLSPPLGLRQAEKMPGTEKKDG